MLNGQYVVSFCSNHGTLGTGVVTVIDGQVSGGDSQYRYTGTMSSHVSGAIKAHIKINRYVTGGVSVFGAIDSFALTLSGSSDGCRATLTGHIDGSPSNAITVEMQKSEQLAAE